MVTKERVNISLAPAIWRRFRTLCVAMKLSASAEIEKLVIQRTKELEKDQKKK